MGKRMRGEGRGGSWCDVVAIVGWRRRDVWSGVAHVGRETAKQTGAEGATSGKRIQDTVVNALQVYLRPKEHHALVVDTSHATTPAQCMQTLPL